MNDDTGPRDTCASERDGICWHNHDGRHVKCFPPRRCVCHVCGWASQQMGRNENIMARVREMGRIQEEKDRVAHLIEQNRPVPVKNVVNGAAVGVAVSLVLCVLLEQTAYGRGSGLIVSLVAPMVTYLVAIRKGR